MEKLKVIAYARNGHTDKFGIPRQSRDESPIVTRIVFEPEYGIPEAFRGIEAFSHLWVLWGFDKVESQKSKDKRKWSPTVRPPRLGGNKRMGVFATRSPFRPNPIGLSSVKLVKVVYPDKSTNRHTDISKFQGDAGKKEGRMELIVSGADVLDGTPIYDIKPYLSFSDSHPDARNGFAEETKDRELEVDWSLVANESSVIDGFVSYESPPNHPLITPLSPPYHPLLRGKMAEIDYILRQDPRPGYQNDPEREYKMDYGGWRVTFRVNSNSVVVVCQVSKI